MIMTKLTYTSSFSRVNITRTTHTNSWFQHIKCDRLSSRQSSVWHYTYIRSIYLNWSAIVCMSVCEWVCVNCMYMCILCAIDASRPGLLSSLASRVYSWCHTYVQVPKSCECTTCTCALQQGFIQLGGREAKHLPFPSHPKEWEKEKERKEREVGERGACNFGATIQMISIPL